MNAMNRLFFSLRAKMLTSLLLVALADILFYAEPSGWGCGVFAFCLLALVAASQQQALKTWGGKAVAFLSATLAADMVAEPGILSVLSFCLSLLTLLMLQKRQHLLSAPLWIKDIGRFLAHVLKIWNHKLFRLSAILKKRRWNQKLKSVRRMGHIALPFALAVVFAFLFAQANPVLMQALEKFDWTLALDMLSPYRWFFWLWSGAFIWALLRPRFSLAKPAKAGTEINIDALVNRTSIVLSLILFNLLFALQNALDLAYLWRRQTLPGGMNYAEYAHAGAYPLIATALLAGAYVLVTFGNGGGKYQSPLARQLVYAWIAQNIFLVLSAIDRTLHYIDAYSLTCLRVAALIWMGLVAFGLLTLVVKVAWNRSNLWLININALALAAVVYACCFFNFVGFIANYNVASAHIAGTDTQQLDIPYLESLGWQAAPALRWYAAHTPLPSFAANEANKAAGRLDAELAKTVKNHWQGWTLLRQLYLQDVGISPQP